MKKRPSWRRLGYFLIPLSMIGRKNGLRMTKKILFTAYLESRNSRGKLDVQKTESK
jgi:hypothetical protein